VKGPQCPEWRQRYAQLISAANDAARKAGELAAAELPIGQKVRWKVGPHIKQGEVVDLQVDMVPHKILVRSDTGRQYWLAVYDVQAVSDRPERPERPAGPRATRRAARGPTPAPRPQTRRR